MDLSGIEYSLTFELMKEFAISIKDSLCPNTQKELRNKKALTTPCFNQCGSLIFLNE
jgi:hypothetical protein